MARAGPVKELGLFKETVSVYSAITSRGSGVRQAFKKTAVRWAWWREGRAWALEGQTRSRPSSLLLLDVPPVFKRLQRFPCPAGQRCRLSGPRGVGATCTHCSLGFSAITLTSAPSTWPLFFIISVLILSVEGKLPQKPSPSFGSKNGPLETRFLSRVGNKQADFFSIAGEGHQRPLATPVTHRNVYWAFSAHFYHSAWNTLGAPLAAPLT